MFNINFLGAPGIQPDIVNSYISYRPEDEKNIKNIIVKDESGFFTKIIDYVPSKADYLSFIILCLIIVFFVLFKPENNNLSLIGKQNTHNPITLNSLDLEEKYLILTEFINDIKNNKEIQLLKISSKNNLINFKFISSEIENLNQFRKKIRNKYKLNSRIQGDNSSKFILITEIPWKVYNDSVEKSKIQNFGESSFVIFIIEDLIKEKILHKGNLSVDLNKDDNYFIKFYPAHLDI